MKLKLLLTHTISQNAFANTFRTAFQLVAAMAGNYWIVRTVSAEVYGAWILIFTFTTFINMADLGISSALIRYTAADGKRKADYFWHTMIFYSIAGSILGLILIGLAYHLRQYFFQEWHPPLNILTLTMLSSFFALLGSGVTNSLVGLQRMKRSSLIEVIKNVGFYVLLLFFLPPWGLMGFVYSQLIINIVGFIVGLCLLYQLAPLPMTPFRWTTLFKLLRFGIQTYGIQVSQMIKFSVLKIIMAWFYPLAFVTYLELGQRISNYLRLFLASIILPLFPAAALFQAKEEYHKILKMLKISTVFATGLAFLGTGSVILISPYFIPWWLGHEYQPVVQFAQWAAVATFFTILPSPLFSIMQGLKQLKTLLIVSSLGLIAYTILPYAGGRWLSALAVMQGFAIAEGGISLIFMLWILPNFIANFSERVKK